jgi:hypothetical protein
MDLVKPGRYKAVIVEHGITETKNKDPQAAIRFGIETKEHGYRELVWFGSFKQLALEHTLKALVVCGLDGTNPAGPLEIGKEVSITVEIDKNHEGKERNVVRWINSLGGVGKKIDGLTATAKLDQYSSAVMALKEKLGVGKSKTSDDDLGF